MALSRSLSTHSIKFVFIKRKRNVPDVASFYGLDKNAPQLKAAMYVLNQRPLKMPAVLVGHRISYLVCEFEFEFDLK